MTSYEKYVSSLLTFLNLKLGQIYKGSSLWISFNSLEVNCCTQQECNKYVLLDRECILQKGGQGSLAHWSPRGHREADMTQ